MNFITCDIVTHGTALDNVCEIVRDGIKVGPGTDTKVPGEGTGIFCIAGGPFDCRVAQARKKSKHRPGSFPAVLAWEPWHDLRKVSLKLYDDGTVKTCLPSAEGVARQMPFDCCIFFRMTDFVYYKAFDNLPNQKQYMLCGGRTKDGIHDPLYWSTMHAMEPTCGCHVAIEDLPTSGWQLTKNARVWFCQSCAMNRCRVQFWSEGSVPPPPPPPPPRAPLLFDNV